MKKGDKVKVISNISGRTDFIGAEGLIRKFPRNSDLVAVLITKGKGLNGEWLFDEEELEVVS